MDLPIFTNLYQFMNVNVMKWDVEKVWDMDMWNTHCLKPSEHVNHKLYANLLETLPFN